MNDSQTAQFVQLLTGHQSEIYLYVRSLVFDGDIAADILGEANVTLWEKRHTFTMGSNFRAWAYQIVRYKVAESHARHRREKTALSDEILDKLAEQAQRQAEPLSHRLEDLRHCLKKLVPADRELIGRRYDLGTTVEQIAAQVERPIGWVYKAVYRIRKSLALCVDRQTALRQKEDCP